MFIEKKKGAAMWSRNVKIALICAAVLVVLVWRAGCLSQFYSTNKLSHIDNATLDAMEKWAATAPAVDASHWPAYISDLKPASVSICPNKTLMLYFSYSDYEELTLMVAQMRSSCLRTPLMAA